METPDKNIKDSLKGFFAEKNRNIPNDTINGRVLGLTSDDNPRKIADKNIKIIVFLLA